MNDLGALEAYAANLLASLEPGARADLAKRLASALRASQQRRIAAQQNPDGTAYAPRKPQLRKKIGSVRRQMFAKLRTARYLKAGGSADAALVAFTADVSRVARVHQFGLRDRVNRAGLEVAYQERQLLGLSEADEALIRDLCLAQLAERL